LNIQQACSVLRNLEHDEPSGFGDGFLCFNCGPDFGEFLLDPVIIGAIEMKFAQDLHSLIVLALLDKVTRGFWEEKQSNQQQ
jgi:hypothetical protein